MSANARGIAVVATLAMCALVLLMPQARADEAVGAPTKIQDRLLQERFTAPALVPAEGLDPGALTVRGERDHRADREALYGSSCATATWPHIPAQCLSSGDALPHNVVVRTVTVVHQIDEGTSEAYRVSDQVAAR